MTRLRRTFVGLVFAVMFSGTTLIWILCMYFKQTFTLDHPAISVYIEGITLSSPARFKDQVSEVTKDKRPALPDFGMENKCTPDNLHKLGKPGFFEGIPKQFLPGYKGLCFMIREEYKDVLRCLPHFYVIGITKSGTTELWNKLKLHPQLSVSGVEKEADWWSPTRKRSTPFSTYLDLRSAQMVEQFQRNASLKQWLVTADGSPTTVYEFDNWRMFFGENYDGPNCTTADLLYAVQPKAKLVIALRDPVDRLYSHYLHFHYANGSAHQFHYGVLWEIAKYNNCRTHLSARACAYAENDADFVTLHVGLYSVFIRDWLKVFPREQLHIYRLDDWKENCPKLYSGVLQFVELDSLPDQIVREICANDIPNSGVSKKKKVGPMMEETRQLLLDFYAESNQELSELLGDDRYLWKQ